MEDPGSIVVLAVDGVPEAVEVNFRLGEAEVVVKGRQGRGDDVGDAPILGCRFLELYEDKVVRVVVRGSEADVLWSQVLLHRDSFCIFCEDVIGENNLRQIAPQLLRDIQAVLRR